MQPAMEFVMEQELFQQAAVWEATTIPGRRAVEQIRLQPVCAQVLIQLLLRMETDVLPCNLLPYNNLLPLCFLRAAGL